MMYKIKKHIYNLLLLLLPFCVFSQTTNLTNSYLNYIENKGQWNESILYKSSFRGGEIFVEKNTFTYLFYPKEGFEEFHHRPSSAKNKATFHAVKMHFKNALETATIKPSEKQSHYTNYFLGNDPAKWAGHVSSYKQVLHEQLYPGISVKTFSDNNDVRFDLIVDPAANPSLIQLEYEGQNKLQLKNGDLILSTDVGEIIQHAPVVYQEIKGKRSSVKCNYVLKNNSVSFDITGAYDRSYPLIIDPTLVFATFTGSMADNWGMTATNDNDGNAYTSGICFSFGYPTTTGAFQTNFAGGIANSIFYSGVDISISKFSSDGSTLLYSTYLGGTSNEAPISIIADEAQNLYILGRTYSSNFPVISGAYDNTLNGG